MSIRVGKYDWRNKKEPSTSGYKSVLIHTTGPLSPYTMKDKENIIMENYWQFSKVWEKVDAIKQPLSTYHPHIVRWEHPDEVHIEDDKLTDEYWQWRQKGFHHNRWVRYPNGYENHRKALGTVIGTPDNYKIIDYIRARKKVYFTKYREIAINTKMFCGLKSMLKNGKNIQINEVDGPVYMDEYLYDQVEAGSIEINEDVLKGFVNNPSQPFGHGYCLAACLLDIDVSKM